MRAWIPTVAATFVVLLIASAASAQTLRYDAETGATNQYVRIQKDHVVQTINGQEQVNDIESYWRFAATTEEIDGDGFAVRIVHDSLSIASPAMPENLDFSALYEIPVVIQMTDRGEVQEIVLPDSLPESVARLDLRSTYNAFFPVLPEGEAGEGTAWSDTTEVSTNQNGLDVAVKRVNEYAMAGTETVDGREALRVNYQSSFDLEGAGSQQGAEISLSGSGTGSGHFFIEPDGGVYLGGAEEAEMTMDAFVVAGEQNLVIPIVQTRSETVDLVE